jgi:hypothetical protein
MNSMPGPPQMAAGDSPMIAGNSMICPRQRWVACIRSTTLPARSRRLRSCRIVCR